MFVGAHCVSVLRSGHQGDAWFPDVQFATATTRNAINHITGDTSMVTAYSVGTAGANDRRAVNYVGAGVASGALTRGIVAYLRR